MQVQERKVACPSCGEEVLVRVATVIDAGRQPEELARIREQRAPVAECSACQASFDVVAPFLFLHADRGLIAQVVPPRDMVRWQEVEATLSRAGAEVAFPKENALYPTRRRLVFGLHQLNEKLFAIEQGIDDVSLELAKLGLIAMDEGLVERLSGAGPEFLLEGLDGSDVVFLIVSRDGEGNPTQAQVRVPRALIDAAARDEEFAAQFADMPGAWFVSWLRYVEMSVGGPA